MAADGLHRTGNQPRLHFHQVRDLQGHAGVLEERGFAQTRGARAVSQDSRISSSIEARRCARGSRKRESRCPRSRPSSAGEGFCKPLPGGVYEVNERMKADLAVREVRTPCLEPRRPHRGFTRLGDRRPGVHRGPGGGGRAGRDCPLLRDPRDPAPLDLPRPEPEGNRKEGGAQHRQAIRVRAPSSSPTWAAAHRSAST